MAQCSIIMGEKRPHQVIMKSHKIPVAHRFCRVYNSRRRRRPTYILITSRIYILSSQQVVVVVGLFDGETTTRDNSSDQ